MECQNSLHPEYNGQECACVDCQPIGHCLDGPCSECEGPVKERCEPHKE
jgi:hypothetical protein